MNRFFAALGSKATFFKGTFFVLFGVLFVFFMCCVLGALTYDTTRTFDMCMYEMRFLGGIVNLFLPGVGLFSRCRLRGTQGGRVYTTVQVRGPVGVRGACSGRSKLREMALFHGIIFRDTKLPNTMESPQFQPFALLLLCHTIPSPLKLSTLGHPRYSSRRTSSCSLSDERPWTANLCVRVCHDSCRPTTYLVETNT